MAIKKSVDPSKSTTEESASKTEQRSKADEIVRKKVYYAVGVGFVPIPFVDFIGVTSLQLHMVKQLSHLYDTRFSEQKVKNIISALIGGFIPATTATMIASIVKVIPIIGWRLGAGTASILSGASTYAVGKIFIQHFESGGTILDFQPNKVKENFKALFAKGKEMAAEC